MHDNQQQQKQQSHADGAGETSITSSAINTSSPSSLNFSQANTQHGPIVNQDINQQFFLDNNLSLQSRMMNMLSSQSLANNRIPDIILTGMVIVV